MRIYFPVLVLLLPVLQACSPSEDVVATAIANTQTAQATEIPSPTAEPTPTTVPTETPVPTPTPEPTATPDLRVIDIDPRQLLLSKEDLPSDAKYYLPNAGWISPHRNSEVISGWGVEEGQQYLAQTGRIDGWWAAYARGTRTVIAPEEVYDNVVLYRTNEGALLVLSEFAGCLDEESGYSVLSTDLHIGDGTNVCIQKEMQPAGKNRVWLRVEFVYRNVFHGVIGYGWEEEVNLDYVADVAKTLLTKLEAAPLANSVTFEP